MLSFKRYSSSVAGGEIFCLHKTLSPTCFDYQAYSIVIVSLLNYGFRLWSLKHTLEGPVAGQARSYAVSELTKDEQ